MMRFEKSIPGLLFRGLCAGVFFLVLGACASRSPGLDERSLLSEEEALLDRARSDLSYLEGPEAEGRRTATRGFNRTASYLAGQLRDAGIQPVRSGEYRIQYAARIRRSLETRILWLGSDTTRAVAGEDFLIMEAPTAVEESGSFERLPQYPWIVWNEDIDSNRGPADRWSMDIRVEERATTAPMHIAGMIPGAHPTKRDSVVIWIAPVDGTGLQGEQSWTDGSDLAIPAAALLSAMRRAAGHQQDWAVYPQTIMVAFLSGTRDDCAGPDMFFRHLPWDRSLVSRVMVAEMASEGNCNWESLWLDYAGDTLRTQIKTLQAYVPFSAAAEQGFGTWRSRSEALRPVTLDVASSEAQRLAREFVRWLP